MVIGLLMGCNNGGESADGNLGKVMMEVGKSIEKAFYSFIELISDTLGSVRVDKDTKKSAVGGYFNSLGEKLGKVSDELEAVAVKAEEDGDKEASLKNSVRIAVEAAKKTLKELKDHLDSLKDIGGDSQNVGWAATGDTQGAAANQGELENVFKALKGIFDIAITNGDVKSLKSGSTTLQVSGGVDNKDGAKILSTSGGATATAPAKAAAILASVSGEEILVSIVGSEEGDAGTGVSSGADSTTSALKFAKGGSATNLANSADAKAAAVAGGIALRALVKGGQLAAGATDKSSGEGKEVQGVGVTAVNKLLVAVEDVIKKTVKKVLDKAKVEIDKARASKSTVQK